MLTCDFYNIFGVLLFLGVLKSSLTHSRFTSFLTIFLGSCLSFTFFESCFVFLTIGLYFTQSGFQSLFAWLKALFTNPFSFGKNQTGDVKVLPITEKEEEEKQEELCSTKSFLDREKSSSCPFPASPVEEVQKFQSWVAFVLSLVSIYISNQVVLAVLCRLSFTEEWVKGMVDKGWPRWVFFWLRFDKPGQLTEYALFHFMMCILGLNFVTLYIIVRML